MNRKALATMIDTRKIDDRSPPLSMLHRSEREK